MSLLSAGQTATMRDVAARALPGLATVQRLTRVPDGGGGFTEQWTDLAVNVPCRIAPVGGGETGTRGGRIADETTHVATFPAGQDVTEADRIVINGTTYEATLVRERGGWEITRRVEVMEAS